MPTATPIYEPPDPRDIPEWRAKTRDYLGSNIALTALSGALAHGKAAMIPTVPGLEASGASIAAKILTDLEVKRLTEADLYFCDNDMTAMALAAAEQPPLEPCSRARLPSDSGLMVFAQPIGGYTQPLHEAIPDWTLANDDLKVTTPIIAVSWSTWHPHCYQVTGGPPVTWLSNQYDGLTRVPPDFDGVWLTFWSSPKARWGALPPDEPVFTDNRDGRVIRARDLEALGIEGATPIAWDNESVMKFGADLSAPPQPDTTDEWVHVVYTAWQLAQQRSSSGALTETEEVPRIRAGRRRDERAGITGSSAVKLIRLHPRYRRDQAPVADETSEQPKRQRAWRVEERWMVPPHRRYVCQNPRKHRDGECEHVDRIIPWHPNGPKGKPIRGGTASDHTVHVWNAPEQ